MLTLVLITILLFGLAFAGIAIRILLKKDGKFAGTCAGNSSLLQKDNENCSVCGARPDEKCKAPDK